MNARSTPSPAHAAKRSLPLLILAAAVCSAYLAGCSSLQADNPALLNARSNYSAAQNNPQTASLAAAELRQAGDAIEVANAAWSRGDRAAQVDHLAYVADQRVTIATETGRQKAAESAVVAAAAQRDQMRLAARTSEADSAQRSAVAAQQSAAIAQGQSEAAQRQAAASQRQASASQQQSEASQRQSEASQRQAADAEMRSRELELLVKELNARQTERGLVITLGDVLFDTNRSTLSAGAQRSLDALVSFLAQYPLRRVLVEGFTDNVGSEGTNQVLSGERAQAVRMALVRQGVASARIATQGYGEAYPVAANETSGGRQANRRVEIVLSDDAGVIIAR